MKRTLMKSGLTKKYTVAFYGIMLLLAAGLTMLMLYFASEKFVNYELSSIMDAETQAANDVEMQHGVMRDVVTQIRASSEYRPSVLNTNRYRDIELLNDFKRFRNYSPLIESYFLLYNNSNRLYTSEGYISYYEFYASSTFGLTGSDADDLYRLINDLKAETICKIGKKVLFLFPVRFVNEETDFENAAICFILPDSTLINRVIPFQARGGELISLNLGEVTVYGTDGHLPIGTSHEEGNTYRVTTRSENGFVSLSYRLSVSRNELILSALPAWLYIGIVLLILLVALVGVLFGKMIISPIRSLVVKYISPSDYIRDELEELDGLISRMEAENHNSRRLLRDRTLMAVLQGYYSKQLIERWGFLNLSFDHKMYQVALTREPGNEKENEALINRLEANNTQGATVYACKTLTENLLALIIGYDTETAYDSAIEQIHEAIGEDADIYFGKECTSALRISASYMEAIGEIDRARGSGSADIHCFITRMIAFSQEGSKEEMARECAELCERYKNPSAHTVRQFALASSAELAAAAAEKHVDLNRESLSSLALLTDFNLCLNDITEIVQTAFPFSEKQTGGKTVKLSDAIIGFIRDNAFDPDLDLQTVADQFRLSGDYISTVVKAASGESFKEYLTGLRMAEAGRLLREETQLTVNEVSLRVGYRKVSNFIKKFKDVHGVTPSQYR